MKYISFLLILLAIFAVGCERDISGERDDHGCLGPSGYTWDEEIGACTRGGEIDTGDKQQAAQIAVKHIGMDYGLTVIEIIVVKCPGCFIVNFDKNGEIFSVVLEGWEIEDITYPVDAEVILSPEECIAKGGRTVNIVGEVTCKDDEINIGKVVGFISPNICCKPEGRLTLEEALIIAEQSDCVKQGELSDNYMYNHDTGSWWIDLNIEKEGCAPVCVVSEETGKAEINWRCA